MSKPEAPEPPPAVGLNVNAIVAGVFFLAGSALPFTSESGLPTSLRALVATAEAPPPEPFSRNIYDMSPSVRRQCVGLKCTPHIKNSRNRQRASRSRRRRLAALRAEHELHIGLARAQAEVNAHRVDDTYKHLEEEAAGKVNQLYVRRGGALGKTQNSRLKPGETRSPVVAYCNYFPFRQTTPYSL